MLLRNIIAESFADWNTGKWIHYSDHEMLTFNLKQTWQDPIGIYLFPENFVPKTNMWPDKRYKFTVTLKPNAHILDYGTIDDAALNRLLHATKAWDGYQDSLKRYPPKNRNDMLDCAWEQMRSSMILGAGGGKAKWNNILRSMGWDAIFDDTNSIYHGEVQLLLLNPAAIAAVHQDMQKVPVFAAMQKVVDDVRDLAAQYGEVEVEEPRKRDDRSSWGGGPKTLSATIDVRRSEANYISIVVRYDPKRKGIIDIHVRWARPSLNAGYGAKYDIRRAQYDSFGSTSSFDEIRRALELVFSQHKR